MYTMHAPTEGQPIRQQNETRQKLISKTNKPSSSQPVLSRVARAGLLALFQLKSRSLHNNTNETEIMSRKKRMNKKQKVAVESEEADLDRFAGSSDEEEEDAEEVATTKDKQKQRKQDESSEEDDDDEEEEEDEEEVEMAPPKRQHLVKDTGHEGDKEEDSEDDDEVENSDSDSEDDDDGDITPSSKMADAMARILNTPTTPTSKRSKSGASSSTSPSTSTISAILSKTTTPLQRQAQEESKKQKELKEKRQVNRERKLAAMHIPLLVATTNNIPTEDGQLSVSEELEFERLHRRVATRGVVALFNAISTHQKSNNTVADEYTTKRKKDTPKLSKHGFLEQIKSKAAAAAAAASIDGKKGTKKESSNNSSRQEEEEPKSKKAKGGTPVGTPQWNALKDDYMLNPKKNWDEESSNDGSSDDDNDDDAERPPVDVDDEVVEEKKVVEKRHDHKNKGPKKRRRVGGRQ